MRPDLWVRPVQARLTGVEEWRSCQRILRPGHIVEEARCGSEPLPPMPLAVGTYECAVVMRGRPAVLRTLVEHPECTDAAIIALQQFARKSADARSDLAAAYYLRAQRGDRASDLLDALEAARQAVEAAPKLAAARFNLALIQEALHFNDDAIVSWDLFRQQDHSAWAEEARQHSDALVRRRTQEAASAWSASRMDAALAAGDRGAVATIAAAHPFAALRHLEDELLPRWVDRQTPQALASASLLAGELRRRSRDPYTTDLVEAATNARRSPAAWNALRFGLSSYVAARQAEVAYEQEQAERAYARAVPMLRRGGTPLGDVAQLQRTVMRKFLVDRKPFAPLDAVEATARRANYFSLLGRAQAAREYLLFADNRFVEALAAADEAKKLFDTIDYSDQVAAMETRTIGLLRVSGQLELAWREALADSRRAARLATASERNLLTGETMATVQALGHPAIALWYQNESVRRLQQTLVEVPPEQLGQISSIQQNLSIALRSRAAVELRLRQHAAAERDLTEAIRLLDARDRAAGRNKKKIVENRRALNARIQEVRGEALLDGDPNGAVKAFTEAIELASQRESASYTVELLARRAEAQRRAHRPADAKHDLQLSLKKLRKEETLLLAHRVRGRSDDYWGPYFARFQATYHALIRQLVEEGNDEEAFAYAERARAVDPLNLMEQAGAIPRSLSGESSHVIPLPLARLRAALPPGTFLIEYCVLDDRTYIWILSRDAATFLPPQDVHRADVERWTTELQRAAHDKNETRFDLGLYAPFAKLMQPPLDVIRSMPGGEHPANLVFVLDGAMHGLPIAALREPGTNRYLIERAPVSIAGSAMLYRVSQERDRTLPATKRQSVLLFGDPAFDIHIPLAKGMPRLPGARREVEELQRLYARDADVQVRTGLDATVPEFIALARRSSIVHLASHAVANAERPTRSSLLLAPSAHESGVIEADALLARLKLDRTRLVVLAACGSAGGSPVGSEGVAPLVRPLIGAGVPAVIGSLWDVDDDTVDALLVSFHHRYRQGDNAAVALQGAQRELLGSRKAGDRSVLRWAPFQVIGYASSPYAPHHTKENFP